METPKRYLVRDDTGEVFNYADPFELDAGIPGEDVRDRILSAETPGGDGEYQEPTVRLETRVVSLKGTVTASSLSDMQGKMDTLSDGHPRQVTCKLFKEIRDGVTVVSSRFLRVRRSYLSITPRKVPGFNWEVGFRSIVPLWEENTLRSLNLASGANAITPGGVEEVLPVFTLVVTHVGTITVTESATATSFTLTADATGTYVIDSYSRPRSCTLAGTDVLSQLSGQFLTLVPDAHTLTVTLSGGATISGASKVEWRRRYPFALP